MKKILGMIPARYHSSRFLGKPLAPILGKPLIQRTYENALQSHAFDDLYVLTDDEQIFSCVESFGGKVLMTPPTCKNGTDRIVQALKLFPSLAKASTVVNIQGDSPCIQSTTFLSIIKILQEDKKAVMSTAISPLEEEKKQFSHIVKCVFDTHQNALYFSRSPIPFSKNQNSILYHHIGVYAYKTSFLLDSYPKLQETPFYQLEDLEQNQVLENGFRIKVAKVEDIELEVNVPEDIKKVEEFLCR